MCIITMTNDGGLNSVLQTSELVSNRLFSLSNRSNIATASIAGAGAKRKPSRSLSEISGNTDKSIRMDLAQHTSSELKQVIAPLIKELEKLDAAALLSLNPSKNGKGEATLRQGLTVPPIHDRVSPQYPKDESNIVRYLHVKEVPHKFSAGIFVFPPNAEIPLHDHPDMVVLSRVLYGDLRVQSFDVLPDNNDSTNTDQTVEDSGQKRNCADNKAMATSPSPSRPPVTLRNSFNKIKDFVSRALSIHDEEDETMLKADSILRVKPNLNPMGVHTPHPQGPSTISAPNVTCLFPHEGNCHAFVAGPEGAAVLDILLPPYDNEDNRDCTFYEKDDEGNDSSLTLSPIHQPEDFHCVGGAYGRFGDCEEYCDDDPEDDDPEDDDMGTPCNLS